MTSPIIEYAESARAISCVWGNLRHFQVALSLVLLGLALPLAARAQTTDDIAHLEREIGRLMLAGKNMEALPLARRHAGLIARRHGDDHPARFASVKRLADLLSTKHGGTQGAMDDCEEISTLLELGKHLDLLKGNDIADTDERLEVGERGAVFAATSLYRLHHFDRCYVDKLTGVPLRSFHCARVFERAEDANAFLEARKRQIMQCLPSFEARRTGTAERSEHKLADTSLESYFVTLRSEAKSGYRPNTSGWSDWHETTLWLESGDKLIDDDLAAKLQELRDAYYAALADEKQPERPRQIKEEIVEITKKAFGPRHTRVAQEFQRLASEDMSNSRSSQEEKVALLREALSILEDAHRPPVREIESIHSSLGHALLQLRRWREAVDAFSRHVDSIRVSQGEQHQSMIGAMESLAIAHERLAMEDGSILGEASLAEAERLFERAFALSEQLPDANKRESLRLLGALIRLLEAQGKDDAVERLFERAIELEKVALRELKAKDPDMFDILTYMQEPYHLLTLSKRLLDRGETGRTELLLRQGLDFMTNIAGEEHRATTVLRGALVEMYAAAGQGDAALVEANHVLRMVERTQDDDAGMALMLVGTAHAAAGRHREAVQAFARAFEIVLKRDDDWEREIAFVEIALRAAKPYAALGDASEREQMMRRSLEFLERQAQKGTIQEIAARAELAAALADQGREAEALDFVLLAASNIRDRLSYKLRAFGRRDLRFDAQEAQVVQRVLELLWSIPNSPEGRARISDAALVLAQVAANTRAAKAIAQTSARAAAAGGKLGEHVARLQKLEARRDWLAEQIALLRSGEKDDKEQHDVARLSAEIGEADAELDTLNKAMRHDFPEYAQLVTPAPLTIAEVAAGVMPDEAFVQFAVTDAATFVWAITPSGSRWARIDARASALADRIAALRCGLDEEEWATPSQAMICGEHLGLSEQPASSDPLPFDLGIAHDLYRLLLGKVEDLTRGKRLLLVPSGPLTSLPFQALVTQKPDHPRPSGFAGYRDVPWLVRAQALTVLPAASSLSALRRSALDGEKPVWDYLGYGDPVLNGDGSSCRASKVDLACPGLASREISGNTESGRARVRGRGRRSADLGKVFAKGSDNAAVLDQVRSLCPLPDTALEIRCVAQGFRPGATEVRLARSATESHIKALSREDILKRYRVLHFATHGLLAGEVELMAQRRGEPALVLTPPDSPLRSDDDGLLMASEVAELKLNADWIVLSACNTAAGGRLGSEALSGLARAFLYAGARALLVSHWPVYSDAAVRLTTAAFASLDRNPKAGRAEALRSAMVELMNDASEIDNSHPAVWAPFVVVGEGSR